MVVKVAIELEIMVKVTIELEIMVKITRDNGTNHYT